MTNQNLSGDKEEVLEIKSYACKNLSLFRISQDGLEVSFKDTSLPLQNHHTD